METPPTKQRKLVIILLAVFVVVGLFLIFLPRNTIDAPPEESTSENYLDSARIVNPGDLAEKMEGLLAYDNLRQDMRVFAKKQYGKYKDKQLVGFEIKGDIKKAGKKISFEGRYGASKNLVSVTATLLNYQRVSASITDQVTKANIDKELPSNSKREQFIGTLPLATPAYSIDYVETTGSFRATNNDGTDEVKAAIETVLLSSTGAASLKDIQYSIFIPRSAGAYGFPSFD